MAQPQHVHILVTLIYSSVVIDAWTRNLYDFLTILAILILGRFSIIDSSIFEIETTNLYLINL